MAGGFLEAIEAVQLGQWLTMLTTIVVGGFATSIALMALHTAAPVNLRNKRIDIVSYCNSRYDEIYKVKTSIIKDIIYIKGEKNSQIRELKRDAISTEIDLYIRRFWGLKSDQLDYWLAGYVDPETLISWFMSTIHSIYDPVSEFADFDQTLLGGWKKVKEFHKITNPRMFQVVDEITKGIFKYMGDAERYGRLYNLFFVIEDDEDRLIKMLARNRRSRLTMKDFKDKLPNEIRAYAL